MDILIKIQCNFIHFCVMLQNHLLHLCLRQTDLILIILLFMKQQ